jgi:ATP phosphoribosyltransferase
MADNLLRIGIPKGSLQDSTLNLFARAGFSFYGSERSLWLASSDPEMKPVLLRPQEIPRYVADGSLDCGLAGWDWIHEAFEDGLPEDSLEMLTDLCYSKRTFRPIRWVLAVKKDGQYNSVQDLQKVGDSEKRIATELVKTTERWLATRGIIAKVAFSWGATEAKVGAFADAIVEATETGASLESNGLKILDTIFTSTTRFFANREAYRRIGWKRTKLDAISLLLKSCLQAEVKETVRVVAGATELPILEALIPSDASYTVSQSQDGNGIIDIVILKAAARDLIPRLARNGACRITTSPVGILYE